MTSKAFWQLLWKWCTHSCFLRLVSDYRKTTETSLLVFFWSYWSHVFCHMTFLLATAGRLVTSCQKNFRWETGNQLCKSDIFPYFLAKNQWNAELWIAPVWRFLKCPMRYFELRIKNISIFKISWTLYLILRAFPRIPVRLGLLCHIFSMHILPFKWSKNMKYMAYCRDFFGLFGAEIST